MDRFRIKLEHQLLFLSAITFLAIVLAYALFLSGRQGLFWDSRIYVQLGERIATQGLFQFYDDTRTFGYPLFIAILWLLSDHSSTMVQFLIFNVQLLIYLSTCIFAFAVFKPLLKTTGFRVFLFAALALNPFLLIYTGEVLSELLSATFIFLSLLFAIRPPTRVTNGGGAFPFLSCFVAGCAVMVRPANLTIVAAVAASWFLRHLIFKEGARQTLLWMIIGFIIPFIPQLINNYKAYPHFQPLIARNLYGEQLSWGMQYLKWVGVALPVDATGMAYVNPFWSPAIVSLSDFFLKMPREFFFTQGIHLFALFDYDYAFPYIRDLDAWYRLPLTIANCVFLFGVACGIVEWFPRVLHPESFNRLDLALASMLMGTLAYLPAYVMVVAEPRFSLPLYLLLAPFSVTMLERTQMRLIRQRWKWIAFQIFGLIIFLTVNLSLYRWVQSQVPFLDATANSALSSSRYSMRDVHIRFGDRIELVGYGIDQTRPVKGGDTLYLVLKWWCSGAATEAYDEEIALVDSENRVWSQTTHNPLVTLSPCTNRLWVPSLATDNVVLRLPVTLPGGEYKVVLSIHDQASDRYLLASSDLGALLGKHLMLTAVSIDKNKGAFTASQLQIENRYFVDMQELRLLGYTALPDRFQPGDKIDLGLYWRARSKPRDDYLVVIQLRDSFGKVIIEQSARPATGTYPTTEWNEGEVLLDWHSIPLPNDISTGEYQIVVLLRNVVPDQVLGEASISKISIAR